LGNCVKEFHFFYVNDSEVFLGGPPIAGASIGAQEEGFQMAVEAYVLFNKERLEHSEIDV
jgi:hypothetical protein